MSRKEAMTKLCALDQSIISVVYIFTSKPFLCILLFFVVFCCYPFIYIYLYTKQDFEKLTDGLLLACRSFGKFLNNEFY